MTDDLLDKAIASYSSEPRSGLEERVLQHVHARTRRRRYATFFWLPIAAGLLLIFTLPRHHDPAPPLPRLVVTARPPVLPPQVLRVAHKPRPLPRQSVFPTPVPLTAGEKALLSLMQKHPEAAQWKSSEPLEIAPLEFQPLKTEIVQ
jgi:hypothetical protein